MFFFKIEVEGVELEMACDVLMFAILVEIAEINTLSTGDILTFAVPLDLHLREGGCWRNSLGHRCNGCRQDWKGNDLIRRWEGWVNIKRNIH